MRPNSSPVRRSTALRTSLRSHHARLAVEIFEDRVPIAESIGMGLTLHALAGAAGVRFAHSAPPTEIAQFNTRLDVNGDSKLSALSADHALDDVGSVSVLNPASDFIESATALDTLFPKGLNADASASGQAAGAAPPGNLPLESGSTAASSPRPDSGASQTPFAFQPAQPDGALWQAANSLLPGPASGERIIPSGSTLGGGLPNRPILGAPLRSPPVSGGGGGVQPLIGPLTDTGTNALVPEMEPG